MRKNVLKFYIVQGLTLQPHRKGFKRKYLNSESQKFIRRQKRMKKAVFETGGKQQYVEVGSVLYVEKLDAEAGSEITFDHVLMANGNVGTPYVKGAKVVATVAKHGKQKKVIIFKYNPKKKYRKKQGHRQPYTKLEIKDIKA